MTYEQLQKANELQNEIDKLRYVADRLECSIRNYESNLEKRQRKPILRFLNLFKSRQAEREGKKEAAVFIFAEDSNYGTDIPADCDLIIVINEYIQKKLSEKRSEFQNIGKDAEIRKEDEAWKQWN